MDSRISSWTRCASNRCASARRGGPGRRVRLLVAGACGLAVLAAACAAPRPTPTRPPGEAVESPLFGRAATQIALSPPAVAPRPADPTVVLPTPAPTPTPLPGSVPPPSNRVRLVQSVLVRAQPRADAPATLLGQAPARLVAKAAEVNGEWVRIEAAGVSGWVPRNTVEFIQR